MVLKELHSPRPEVRRLSHDDVPSPSTPVRFEMLKLTNQPDDLHALRALEVVTDQDDVVMLAAQ